MFMTGKKRMLAYLNRKPDAERSAFDSYPEAFTVRYDPDEPDDAKNDPLKSKEQFYSILKERIKLMKKAI